MTDQQIVRYPLGDVSTREPAAAHLLRLAAAPVFAIMAVVAGIGTNETLCVSSGISALSGMMPMYLLMCVFHIAPWLRLISGRQPQNQA